MVRRFIFSTLTLALLSLSACAYKNPAPAEGKPIERTTSAIGPFSVAFDPAGAYSQTIDAPISQPSGKVEYFVDSTQTRWFQVVSTSSTVFSCDSSKSNYAIFWLPDATQSTGEYVMNGSTLTTAAGKKGVLLLVFDKLDACTRLVFTLKLKKVESFNIEAMPGSFSPR